MSDELIIGFDGSYSDDITTIEVAEEQGGDAVNDMPDWSILEDARAERVLHQVAIKLSMTFAGVTTADDQHQEGAIWLAQNHALARAYLAEPHTGERALYRRLYDRLFNDLRTPAIRSNLSVPHHEYVSQELAAE